jgi:hypothetical protein
LAEAIEREAARRSIAMIQFGERCRDEFVEILVGDILSRLG